MPVSISTVESTASVYAVAGDYLNGPVTAPVSADIKTQILAAAGDLGYADASEAERDLQARPLAVVVNFMRQAFLSQPLSTSGSTGRASRML